MKRFNIYLPRADFDRLARMAASAKFSKAAMIRKAVALAAEVLDPTKRLILKDKKSGAEEGLVFIP